jgi:hypothetical protein
MTCRLGLGGIDGQIIDRYGLHGLIGFEGDEND